MSDKHVCLVLSEQTQRGGTRALRRLYRVGGGAPVNFGPRGRPAGPKNRPQRGQRCFLITLLQTLNFSAKNKDIHVQQLFFSVAWPRIQEES